jgi:hypothetical protein
MFAIFPSNQIVHQTLTWSFLYIDLHGFVFPPETGFANSHDMPVQTFDFFWLQVEESIFSYGREVIKRQTCTAPAVLLAIM